MTGAGGSDPRHAPVLGVLWMTAAALFFIRGYGIDRVRHERVRAELEARTHSR